MTRFTARTSHLVPIGAVLLTLALIYRRLVAGWVLAGGDLHLYFFPYWAAAARAWAARTLPAWNPYLFTGAPLLANSQAGIFYPLNWPLWGIAGADLEAAARTLHWSVLIHLGLAAVNTYALARRLRTEQAGAALAALLYAGGGFLGLHVEHLNQLQGLAWLPLLLWPPGRDGWPAPLSLIALAMILLAGHMQTAFIALVGLGVVHLARHFPCLNARHLLRLAPYTFAPLMTAVQLLPTFALARFSVRSGGLPWREAVSFSVRPWELPRVLLPPYAWPPLLPEGVAYVGFVGLTMAAVGAWRAWRTRDRTALALMGMGAVGLVLALGGYNPLYLAAAQMGLPGVAHFRAPARYLALYALAVALLAGKGLMRTPRRWQHLAVVLTAMELLLCAEKLPHARATASPAYTDLRPATAHLVAAAEAARTQGQPPPRFLSISQTLFDVGDEAEIETIYGDVLPPDALWAYLVAAKQREVLAPNLPLAFGVQAVDGYDGGLLPTRPYVTFSHLLLPEGTLDGRLRENLPSLPEERWLSLLGVRYLVTDKVGDLWMDGIFYDRQFWLALSPGEEMTLAWLPSDFEADALGLIYRGAGEVTIALDDGRQLTLPLPPTGETGGPTRLRWAPPAIPLTVTLRAVDISLVLDGASLVDERTGAFYPLVLSDRWRLVHSGDVKIYENLASLPRAFLVHAVHRAGDDGSALARMQAPDFDPTLAVVLQTCGEPVTATGAAGGDGVRLLTYAPGEIRLEVTTTTPAVLVVTEGWAPGWRVTLDGTSWTSPCRADLLFQGVAVPTGRWRVVLRYIPPGLRAGAWLSALGIVLWVGYTLCQPPFPLTRAGATWCGAELGTRL